MTTASDDAEDITNEIVANYSLDDYFDRCFADAL